jgi:ABC-type antimicrobial peptide transport system permease subunit
VVSYSVRQRIREIGIRAALGARERDILGLIMRDGLGVVLLGSSLGLGLAWAAVRLTSANVVAMPAIDLFTFAGIPLVLAGVVLLACYIPARRAARVDPMVTLREL